MDELPNPMFRLSDSAIPEFELTGKLFYAIRNTMEIR